MDGTFVLSQRHSYLPNSHCRTKLKKNCKLLGPYHILHHKPHYVFNHQIFFIEVHSPGIYKYFISVLQVSTHSIFTSATCPTTSAKDPPCLPSERAAPLALPLTVPSLMWSLCCYLHISTFFLWKKKNPTHLTSFSCFNSCHSK